MKILELRLHAFGPFTDCVLDFSAGREGLHLVVGPNEAGKSSALRALKQALFKIPARSSDDFVHPHRKLKLGLRLRSADGHEITVVRRKGNANTLLDEDENPIPESVLAAHLNGLTEGAFSQGFALDHDELVRGGKSIVAGKGELGEVLFQAAGGARDLLKTRERLRLDLDELFKSGGSKPRINARITELKQARDRARECSLPSAKWLEHEANRIRAESELVKIETELSGARARRHRLQRLSGAILLFNKRREWLIKWDELSDVAILEDDFSERRGKLTEERIRVGAEHEGALRSLAEIDAELKNLVVPESVLADADRIEQLREAIGDFRKLVKALPVEREKLRAIELEARRIALELGVAESDDWAAQARSMRLARGPRSTIKSLCREHADRATKRADVERRIAELESRLHADRREWKIVESIGSTDALAAALAEANAQGDIENQAIEVRGQLERLRFDASTALARLPLWSSSLEALAVLPVPASQTIERFDADFTSAQSRKAALQDKIKDARQDESQALAELERLRELAGALPDENDLLAARHRRDALWSTLRSAWEREPAPSQFLGDGFLKLAEEYERAIAHADALVDRLRREAGRIAEQAALQSRLDQSRRSLTTLAADLADASTILTALDARWSTLWTPLGIDPLSPREMLAWIGAHKDLLRLIHEIQDQHNKLSLIDNAIARIRESLERALRSAGESVASEDGALRTLKRTAEKAIKRLEAAAAKRERLGQSLAELEIKLETARTELAVIAERRVVWLEAWSIAVAPLRLDDRATPEAAESVIEQADDLMNRLKDVETARSRVESLERDRDRFLRMLGNDAPLSADGSVDLDSTAAVARDLVKAYEDALKRNQRRDGLIERRRQEQLKASDAALALENLKPRFADLCRSAGVADVEQLPLAEKQSREAAALREQLAELEEQLAALAGQESLESFEQAARALDVDRLPDELAALDQSIKDLEGRTAELNQTLGGERNELALMNGGAGGAEAAQQAEAITAELAQDVEEYARVRLASKVLEEVVERYRKTNQGPVLGRAGEIFSRLTLHAFSGLRVILDDDGRHLLQAVRSGGDDPVVVEGLSDGTADQLFLALRLASLEVALQNQPPLPLLLDDVLIQFDDRRAQAALDVLAELSTRTQIVLFTHHEHLCTLAQATLSPETLFVHRLP